MLTISVKNFGPIAEGSVDLKPLTIFVGPSNTGKSYMATAVHAVTSMTSHIGRIRRLRNQHGVIFQANIPDMHDGVIPREILRIFEEWVRQQVSNSTRLSDQTIPSLPLEVRLWLEEATIQRLNKYGKDVIEQLRQIHGGITELVNLGSEPNDFRLTVRQDTPMMNLEIPLPDSTSPQPEFELSQSVIPNVPPNLPPAFLGAEQERWVWPEIVNALVNSASDCLVDNLPDQSYYLPAARSGIAQGHKVLSAALVRQSSYVGLQEMHIPTLPAITTEFLSYLIRLDRRTIGRHNNEGLRNAIGFIETSVLRGRVDLDESGGLPYPEIVYLQERSGANAKKFRLDHTSSMVSELAPLILFLKYLVNQGDLLILEEPESHLHPAAQRQLARGIVRLVNAGVKVLITTHSDFFVNQINNLLRASYASKRWLRENGFTPEDCLKHDDVSAYLFRMDEEIGGSRVEELEIQRDIGIEDPLFSQAIHELYEETLLVERVKPK